MQENRRANREPSVKWSGRIKASVLVLLSTLTLAVSWPVLAQGLEGSANQANVVSEAAGIGTQNDLITIIGRVINVVLGFTGVIFLLILLYAGFMYMTAGGNPDQVKKAVLWIRNGIIGLIIIVFSFAIVNFIMGWLAGGGTGFGGFGGGGPSSPGGGFGQWGNSGSLGTLIEYHFPERDQKDVPRNTAIAISFKEPIDPASFVKGWTSQSSSTVTALNDDLVKIHPQKNTGQDLSPDQARVHVSADKKTVIIKPTEPLGNATEFVYYEVVLTGQKDGIKNASGTALFTGSFADGYSWSFQVSTQIDTTPPSVVSRIPYGVGPEPRNVVVQVEFTEPMLPLSVSGFYRKNNPNGNFQNLTATKEDNNLSDILDGEWRVSNGYRSVNFIPDNDCGTNSCMMKVYCLPASSTVRGLVKAATLSTTPPQAAEMGAFGFDGAVDMAGNSLDGNHDGISTGPGPGGDDYEPKFAFKTTDQIKLSAPAITAIDPTVLQGGVALDKVVEATWDSLLLAYSVNTAGVTMQARGPKEKALGENSWWVYPRLVHLNANGTEVQFGEEPVRSRITLVHRQFLPSDAPKGGETPWDPLNMYAPFIRHTVMDIYQNCFKPATSKLGTDTKAGSNNLCNEENKGNTDCNKADNWKPKPE